MTWICLHFYFRDQNRLWWCFYWDLILFILCVFLFRHHLNSLIVFSTVWRSSNMVMALLQEVRHYYFYMFFITTLLLLLLLHLHFPHVLLLLLLLLLLLHALLFSSLFLYTWWFCLFSTICTPLLIIWIIYIYIVRTGAE